ncbi:MAG TPA: fibro-slime domain-containing protein [Polyangiales bacterium]
MSSNWKRWLLSTSVVCGVACGSSDGGNDGDGGESIDADGGVRRDGGRDASTSRDSSTSADGGDGENCGALMARLRDFRPGTPDAGGNPDFEAYNGSGAAKGILAPMLDGDSLPVFSDGKGVVTSKASFDQWYRNVPGINMEIDLPIELSAMGGGSYGYQSSAFFPLDGKGFGNYNNTGHNFHFTTQIATSFTYGGGEVFEFEGDDDLWIFVNKRLALDLGGVHPAVKGSIDFDKQAAALGIVKGETYPMDIFHAERHTSQSNFKIRTTISCFMPPILL